MALEHTQAVVSHPHSFVAGSTISIEVWIHPEFAQIITREQLEELQAVYGGSLIIEQRRVDGGISISRALVAHTATAPQQAARLMQNHLRDIIGVHAMIQAQSQSESVRARNKKDTR